MRCASAPWFALLLTVVLAMAPAAPARAHGELDEAALAEFHLHLDEYREEVAELIAEVGPIVSAHGSGGDAGTMAQDLIEHWEEVGVHGAIETYATVTYPTVWQALILLQQAVSGADGVAVASAAEGVKAALWQGFGAVRLAASQVVAGTMPETPASTVDAPAMSASATVDRIISDLEAAVGAYQAGNLDQAEQLIHQTYMTHFEGLEGDLIEYDPDLVSSLEKDFNANLPLLMQGGADLTDVQRQLASMTDQLEAARLLLEQAARSRSEVF